MGGILPGSPPWGTPDHPAHPPGVGHAATLLSACPVSPQGLGRGCHRSPLRGAQDVFGDVDAPCCGGEVAALPKRGHPSPWGTAWLPRLP